MSTHDANQESRRSLFSVGGLAFLACVLRRLEALAERWAGAFVKTTDEYAANWVTYLESPVGAHGLGGTWAEHAHQRLVVYGFLL